MRMSTAAQRVLSGVTILVNVRSIAVMLKMVIHGVCILEIAKFIAVQITKNGAIHKINVFQRMVIVAQKEKNGAHIQWNVVNTVVSMANTPMKFGVSLIMNVETNATAAQKVMKLANVNLESLVLIKLVMIPSLKTVVITIGAINVINAFKTKKNAVNAMEMCTSEKMA